MTKLSDADVIAIRAMRAEGQLRKVIAEEFGISAPHVSHICLHSKRMS